MTKQMIDLSGYFPAREHACGWSWLCAIFRLHLESTFRSALFIAMVGQWEVRKYFVEVR